MGYPCLCDDMIEDIWQAFVYLLLAIAAVLWVIVLFGCASNDPVPPIQTYRAEQGFPVIMP